MLDRPIFISGLRKSGTSMVRNLLDGHPELFVTPVNEMHIFKFTHYRHALTQITGQQKPIGERVDDICNDRWFQSERTVDGERKELRAAARIVDFDEFKNRLQTRKPEIRGYRELFAAVLCSMAEATRAFEGDVDNIRFACKGVQQTEFLPELRSWYPDVRFVYVLRNPYAQLNSAINNMRHNKQGVGRKKAIGRSFRKLDSRLPYPYLGRRLKQMKLSYFFASKYAELYPDNFRILSYDRLLESPEQEMRALAEFLEIEFHPGLLRVTQAGNPMARAGWSVSRHEEGEISKKPLTAWRAQLPALAVRLVNHYFWEDLKTFGFECVESNTRRWKRFDRSEGLRNYVANRFLFTRVARGLLIR